MKIVNIDKAPLAVQHAFKHVKLFFPEVTEVEYDEDCRWTYADANGTAPDFNTQPVSLDVLEDAADVQYSVGVPVTYVQK